MYLDATVWYYIGWATGLGGLLGWVGELSGNRNFRSRERKYHGMELSLPRVKVRERKIVRLTFRERWRLSLNAVECRRL